VPDRDRNGAPDRLDRIVVVGGGLAGLESLVALREAGHEGALTLVSAERRLPYDRPPLSKEILRGDAHDCSLEADWNALDVELRIGSRATGLEDGVVITDRGRLDYDGLVIATGSTPIELPGATDTARVHVLRTLDDALELRARFARGTRVAIVGAGWIGAEVATAAAAAGCSVAVVEAGEAPLCAALPAEVGRVTEPWYAEAGIDLRLGTLVAGIDDEAVQLADGGAVRADCVVVGIGVRPATEWLGTAGVELGARGHVIVDSSLRASLPNVVAVGDCAAWDSELYRTRLHVEHWDNALRAPAVAAATLLGGEGAYDPVPYFWSEQLGRLVQYVGHHGPADSLVLRGDPSGSEWSVCWMSGERLAATLTSGRPRDIAHSRRVIAERRPVDAGKLADPAVPVIEAVP
jgi:NADPH-dependent 2,4-dienoyl-CoA reductase/sulfur reductase-like enzyme